MKNMTSRERVLAAMNLHQPDRVPLMCQFSIGSMMMHLKPNPYEFWYDKNVLVNTLLFADDEKAQADIKKIMEIGMTKGKGFILSTACSIAPMVTRQRLLMLSELVQKWGYYK